jgi:hypothetical protein
MFRIPRISQAVEHTFFVLQADEEFERRIRETDQLPASYGKSFEEFYGVEPLPEIEVLEEPEEIVETPKTECSQFCRRSFSRECIRHVPKKPTYNKFDILETPRSLETAKLLRRAEEQAQLAEIRRLKARETTKSLRRAEARKAPAPKSTRPETACTVDCHIMSGNCFRHRPATSSFRNQQYANTRAIVETPKPVYNKPTRKQVVVDMGELKDILNGLSNYEYKVEHMNIHDALTSKQTLGVEVNYNPGRNPADDDKVFYIIPEYLFRELAPLQLGHARNYNGWQNGWWQ